MTTYSRPRTSSTNQHVYDPYLRPTHVRSHSFSSGTSSPQSFQSNMAMVDGPAPSGNYYGVFLGEPPRGFPSSAASAAGSSPRFSSGTSDGSQYGASSVAYSTHSSNKHAKHSSITFPISVPPQPAVIPSTSRSRNTSIVAPQPVAYHAYAPSHTTISSQPKQASHILSHGQIVPAPHPPSALKRERRSTVSPSGASTASENLPVSELRGMCKFAKGSISECLRWPSNSPLFSRLKRTDDIVGRIFTALMRMANEVNLLNDGDSVDFSRSLHQLHGLLHRALASKSHCQVGVQELDGCYLQLKNAAERLELAIFVQETERRINSLTFEHNVSQETTKAISAEVRSLQSRTNKLTRDEIATLKEQANELTEMHTERVALREKIRQATEDIANAKRMRDMLAGNKTVRFK